MNLSETAMPTPAIQACLASHQDQRFDDPWRLCALGPSMHIPAHDSVHCTPDHVSRATPAGSPAETADTQPQYQQTPLL